MLFTHLYFDLCLDVINNRLIDTDKSDVLFLVLKLFLMSSKLLFGYLDV